MVVNTPPMGWNTWNTFGKDINEELIMQSADIMVSSGLKDCGYNYVVIDDIWSLKERDENGKLVPDPEKFPHGMKYLADYVHSKGLKFGMYSCGGFMTCAGYPASYEYEWVDAATFAEWEIDFLKYDFCFHPQSVEPDVIYKRMGLALANCGRDILFSACSWGSENTKQWIKETGADMWRSTGDIFDSWQSFKNLSLSQIVTAEYNGKGCFNDMDMLIVGMNGKGNVGLKGCTFEEYKMHFSLWALMGSPLMIGCDIRNMDDETKQILMNKEVIAINQDPCYRQPFVVNMDRDVREERKPGEPFYKDYKEETPVIARFLDGGDIAVGIFNFSEENHKYWPYGGVNPDKLGLSVTSGKKLVYRDLWSGEVIDAREGLMLFDEYPAHSCRLFRVSIVDAK